MPTGKSEVGKTHFSLFTDMVGEFPTVHLHCLLARDFLTKGGSVGKFPTVIDPMKNYPTPLIE